MMGVVRMAFSILLLVVWIWRTPSAATPSLVHPQFCRVWSLAVYIDARLNWLYGPFTRRKPPHIRQVLMLATLDTARGLDHQQVLYGRLICIIINNESGFPIFRIVCWLDFHHGHGISRPRPNGRPSPTFFTSWFFVVVPIRSTFIISGNVVDRHAVAGSSPFPIFCCCFLLEKLAGRFVQCHGCLSCLKMSFQCFSFGVVSCRMTWEGSLWDCFVVRQSWNLKVEDNNEQSFSSYVFADGNGVGLATN